jgi:hypothetical protein
MLNTTNRRWTVGQSDRRVYLLIAIVVVLLPALIAFFLPLVLFRAFPTNFIPAYSDEIWYWHQIATFRTVGLNGGYYSYLETPARASFTRFYAHGPFFPIVVGSIARLTGWQTYSPFIFNLIVLSLALTFLILLVRPKLHQLGWLGGLIGTFWAIHLYMPSGMQESLHHAFAIMFAALFFKLIHSDQADRKWISLLTGLLIIVASLLRLTWAILLLPFAWIVLRDRPMSHRIAALVLIIILIGLLAGLSSWMAAPYPNYVSSLMQKGSILKAFASLLRHSFHNLLKALFEPDPNIIAAIQRYELVGLLALILGSALWLKQIKLRLPDPFTNVAIFHLFNLGGIFAFNIALYDIGDWRDFRLLAPHVLLSLIVIVLLPYPERLMKRVLISIIGINLLLGIVFLNTFVELRSRSFQHPDSSAVRRLSDAAHYNKATNNPWCNTVLVTLPLLNSSELLGLSPGLGLSWIQNINDIQMPKSAYILLDIANARIVVEQNIWNLKFLTTTSLGSLYWNPSAGCSESAFSSIRAN